MQEYVALSADAARQALQINPGSSEALTVIADHFAFECNSVNAGQAFQKAIEANQQDPTAHHWYAIFLMERGHINEALEQITLARQIDPLISAVIGVEALLHDIQGNYPQAVLLNRQAAELGIYNGSTFEEGMVAARQGNFRRARALTSGGLIDVDEAQLTAIGLYIDALEDPDKRGDFEAFLNDLGQTSFTNKTIFNGMLTSLGSPQFFSYNQTPDCAAINESVWAESFHSQRGTHQFFNYMQKVGAVDYWREFGWPDDCASLDQTLAECD